MRLRSLKILAYLREFNMIQKENISKSSNNLKLMNWTNNLIQKFREEYDKLPEDVKKYFLLNDLSFPCQVDIIWIQWSESKFTDFQILIFNKLKDMDDAINLHGPFECTNIEEVIDSIEEILKETKWNKLKIDIYFPKGIYDTGKDILISRLSAIIHTINLNCKVNYELPFLMRKDNITDDSFCWTCIGKIQNLDINTLVSDMVTDAYSNIKIYNTPPTPTPKEYYGTYIYPPVWIGDMPENSLRNQILMPPMKDFIQKFDTKYNDKVVIVESDGFIAVIDEDKDTSIDILNEIMASALICGYNIFSVKESEILRLHIDIETNSITWRGFSYFSASNSSKLHEYRQKLSIDSGLQDRSNISEDELLRIIKQSAIIFKDESLKNLLIFFLESFTFLNTSEYSASFILSWTIIEIYLSGLWNRKIKNKGINTSQKKNLTSKMLWPISQKINVFTLMKMITDDEYKTFEKLRKKRNKIIHEGEKCSKDYAKQCLDTARKVLIKEINRSGITDHFYIIK